MCMATMTTGGYGDFTPKPKLGRSFVLIWMIIAILMSSILTSTMADAFYGTDYLDIYKQNIVAKNGSPEERVARNKYKANFELVQDDNAHFEAIGSRKYLAGVVNSDILFCHQETIRTLPQPLRVIKRISKSTPVAILHSKHASPEVRFLIKTCLQNQNLKDTIEESNANYRGYIKYDSFDVGGSLETFLTRNTAVKAMIIIAAVLVGLSLMFEALRHIHKKIKLLRSAEYDVEMGNRNGSVDIALP